LIAVTGLPAWSGTPDGQGVAAGLAVEVCLAARKRGAAVELVGKIGDDGTGDAVVVSLGRLGIGHAALMRDPAHPTPVIEAAQPSDDEAAEATTVILPADPAGRPAFEAADIELALSYLHGATVVVVADPLPETAVAAAAGAATFAGARLVVLVPAGGTVPAAPADAIVLEAPAADDGSFGRLVGTFAGALEAGVAPAAAFREAVDAAGWERVGD
jgi:hypothetical protein